MGTLKCCAFCGTLPLIEFNMQYKGGLSQSTALAVFANDSRAVLAVLVFR